MTLKEFAEYHCINYQTAKTWLRRGRILSEGSGFKIAPLKPGETVEVSLKPGETLEPAETPSFNPETASIAESSALLKRQLIAVHAEVVAREVDPLRDCLANLESLVAALAAENAELRLRVVALESRQLDGGPGQQLNYTTLSAPAIDPPGPQWGA